MILLLIKQLLLLDVNVGSFTDKEYNISGLAHFCEHLLFMGTEKYPKENEYSNYLSKHSGSSNAYTAAEHTNYYFQVGADYLEGALDRFSQFFIAPLFSKSCQDREINAVDSENKKTCKVICGGYISWINLRVTRPIHTVGSLLGIIKRYILIL